MASTSDSIQCLLAPLQRVIRISAGSFPRQNDSLAGTFTSISEIAVLKVRELSWLPLQHVTVPVLVINASNTMWTDEYKEYVHALSPQTGYRVMDGVGHWLMLEKPAEFNAALTELLRKFDLVGK